MWAVDGAVSYQVIGPPENSFSYLEARIGLQARFGPEGQAMHGRAQATAPAAVVKVEPGAGLANRPQ
jgi:hypothetical protein